MAVLIAASTLQIDEQPEVRRACRALDCGTSRAVGQVAEAVVGVEQHVELVGGPVADGHDDVGVHHVVDQRDVLVADALDVVLAEAVLEHRRALERLDGDDPGAVVVLQPVAGGDRAGRSGGAGERGQPQVAAAGRRARARTRGRAPAR